MSQRLAEAIRRFRWPLLGLWLAALAVAGVAALNLPDRLSGGGWYVPGSESKAAAESLKSGFASRGASNVTVVVRDDRHTSGDADFDTRVRGVVGEVTGDPRLAVSGSYGWLDATGPARDRFLGADHRTVLTSVGLRLDDGTARRVLPSVQRDLAGRHAADGLRVSLVSAGSLWGEVNKLSEDGLRDAEMLTLPLILLVLLWLYRGVVAAVVSFVVGVTATVCTFGVLSVLAKNHELSIFVENAATMIGLGVSVDYSLFVISRYADELARGRDRRAALATTLRTSGETVLFSGIIVILAMSSLFLIDLNVIHSIALGVIVVVGFAVLASTLVLPAVLYLLGDRVTAGRLPGRGRDRTSAERRWRRLALRIMRRPVAFLAAAAIALVALAVPALHLRTFTPDARIVPASSPVRWGYDTVREQFGQGTASPMQVVVHSDTPLPDTSAADRVLALHDRIARLPGVTRVDSALDALRAASPDRPFAALSPATYGLLPPDVRKGVDHFVSADRRTAVFEVVPDDYAASEHTRALLDAVRAEAGRAAGGGVTAVVGGETAEGVDANAVIQDHLPDVVAIMLAVVYLLLLVTFRSVLLPVKAIVLNLLSIGATYGVLVLVFQYGVLARLLGAEQVGYLQNFVPVLLIATLFSLSTDYEVFLLNRVREEYRAGADNTTSVATGLARTAPLISGAALLMIAVFAAFAFTGILPIQQLGFGLALAIALDATIIRLVAVPAAMRLMGRWNWWLPGRSVRAPAAAPEPRRVPVSQRTSEQ
ncbi:MMPL family transporter [Gandjariella thermophila]|uniref:Membrane protein n=1 Tax=Gandjariella thermophila TaxID=1931992 RepID=A0A4D4JFU8_9PSEU|nr:MMPL family transporter [Gandjariella thermophila]GDY32767.1 membrane protein [Gandjariella thermophila]